MKSTVTVACSIVLVVSFGCNRGETLDRDEQEYEVVQEGAGGSVTGTLQAPGEAAPAPMPALTGTNADTTTAFTLPNTTTATSSAPAGSIAGTFPQTPTYPTRPMNPQPSAPRPVPMPQPVPEPQPPVVETPPPAPPSTDTTATQPAEEEPADEPEPERDPQPQPEPQPPPPPPTSTGTQQPTATS